MENENDNVEKDEKEKSTEVTNNDVTDNVNENADELQGKTQIIEPVSEEPAISPEAETIAEPIPNEEVESTSEVETEANTEKVKTKKKLSKSKKITIAVLALIIIVAIAVIICVLCFSSKTVDLSQYLSMKYEGYNGHATVEASIDTGKLGEFLGDESLARQFARKATLELNKSKNLSNGDEIKVSVSISNTYLKENKLKLKENKITVTVAGLDDANTIDMSKYIKVEYEGFNGNATAKATVDEEALAKFLDDEDLATKLARKITLKVENNNELSNDNEITIKVSVDKDWLNENGFELKDNSVKVTVSGLNEGKEIDVFKDISVSTSGMSPNITISVKNTSNDEFLKTVKYSLSKSTGISNNEKITITATWDASLAKEKEYVIKSSTMEYTVTADVSYPMSVGELKSNTIEQMKSTFLSKATAKASESKSLIKDNKTDYRVAGENNGWSYYRWSDEWELDLTVGNPELKAMYLLSAKDTSSNFNIAYAIYRVPYTSALTGVTYDWYITVEAKNFSVKSDGTLTENATYNVSTDEGSSQDSAYQKFVNSKKNDYTVESINF